MRRILVPALAAMALCAATPAASAAEPFSPVRFRAELAAADIAPVGPMRRDPLEGFNRRMFAFNAWLVREVMNPVAVALDRATPQPVKTAGNNVYQNLVEAEFVLTNLMVGQPREAGISTLRFGINTTAGVLGLWDPAARLGLQRTEVEFTEAVCGMGLRPGPYIVFPVVGPTTIVSAASLTAFLGLEWWALTHVSMMLANGHLLLDASVGAATLRYSMDLPEGDDAYAAQRKDYRDYLVKHCKVGAPAAGPTPAVL
ncbi:MAG: VacJ family lipoprotein [Alphaproteobacteria bacterium]|nr:VacJ family lipoprotein [Alphaproteobacteria bacterium]